MPQLNVSLLFVACGLYVCQAFSPSFSPSNNGRRYSSRVILNAKEDLDPVEKIFKFLFGEKEEKPLGFTRYNQTTSPENFPAVIDRFAAPVSSDNKDMAIIRPLLAQTRLEGAQLKLAYDANKDGWNADTFHLKLRDKRAGLVVAKTKEGAIVGGFNPDGWVGLGDERACISAFVFTWRSGNPKDKPMKLRKIGGSELAVLDRPEEGIRFGYEDLWIKLRKGPDAKVATSRLGLSYERARDGMPSLFTKSEGKRTELVDLRAYVAADLKIYPFRPN